MVSSAQTSTLLSFEEALANARHALTRLEASVAKRREELEQYSWPRPTPSTSLTFFPIEQEWAASRILRFLPDSDRQGYSATCKSVLGT